MALKPIRRVVTGNDARGRSRVVWDGPAPNTHESSPGSERGWTDLWVFDECPAPLSGETDDGNKPYPFPAEPTGAHLRVVSNKARPANYDPARDTEAIAVHESTQHPSGQAWARSGQTWDRGGSNVFTSAIHKTESVDYGIVLEGERYLILDDRELLMKPGDVVVQLGNWHQWSARNSDCRMAFVLMGGDFNLGGPVGRAPPAQTPPAGVKPVRRIVTVDKEDGTSTVISDAPSPDIRIDPARPGFASTRIWVTDSTPAKLKDVRETLDLPSSLQPVGGSVCRVATFPPDDSWKGRVGEREVRAFFASMGSESASTYSASAPHPYVHKTRTLDFCLVLEGEITLVLDTQEVALRATDIAIVRGSNHAFSNRSNRPAVVAISSHDGRY